MKLTVLLILALSMAGLARAECGDGNPPSLVLTAPGETLVADDGQPIPAGRLKDRWYSLSLDGTALRIDEVRTSRASDFTVRPLAAAQTPAPDAGALKYAARARFALALPPKALLGFHFANVDCPGQVPSIKPGNYASLLPAPVLLHDRWTTTVNSGAATWTLYTDSRRRKDGAMLAGSLSLIASNDREGKRVLVAPAHGMAFERQELLWLGSLRGDGKLDFLFKRVWVTGEVEYILRTGGSQALHKVDQDYPHLKFSLGVEPESDAVFTHVAQHRLPPEGKFGQAAFSIDEATWNEALARAEKEALPKLLFDRLLVLNGEKMRVTMEYLPRAQRVDDGSISSTTIFWEGPVLLKVHYRGKAQVIFQANGMDGDNFHFAAGVLDGEPGLKLSYYPHYNNSFVYYWVWDAAKGRFMRLSTEHSQGC